MQKTDRFWKENDVALLLQSLSDSNIDVDVFLSKVETMKDDIYLKQHKYTIWQGGDEKWISYLPDKTKKEGRRQISAVSEKGIKQKLIRFYKDKEAFPTFQRAFDLWIEEKLSTDVTKRTVDKYRSDFRRFFVGSYIVDMRVDEISEKILATEIKKIIKSQDLTAKTYSGLRTIVSGTLKYAKANGYSEISSSSFFEGMMLSHRIFAKTTKTDSSQVYSKEDTERLIVILQREGEQYRPLSLGILFTFRTGLRIGELMALKAEDVDGNILHVRRQHISNESNVFGKREHRDVPYAKTAAGIRDIILTPKAIEVVQEMISINPNGEFIFMRNGLRLHDITYNKYLRRICAKNNIPYKSMHKIRKTYGTLLFDGGVDERFIMKQMGHKDINTTRKYYQYCNKSHETYGEQINAAISI